MLYEIMKSDMISNKMVDGRMQPAKTIGYILKRLIILFVVFKADWSNN